MNKLVTRNHRRGSARAVVVTLLLILLVAGGILFARSFYIVKTASGLHLVPKIHPGFKKVYVDARSFTIADLIANRDVALSMVRSGLGGEIPQVRAFRYAVDHGIRTAQEFEARYGVIEKGEAAMERMRQIDERYRVSDRLAEGIDKAKQLDQRYHVTDRLKEGASALAKKLEEQAGR